VTDRFSEDQDQKIHHEDTKDTKKSEERLMWGKVAAAERLLESRIKRSTTKARRTRRRAKND
jgi:hypothetical protein